MATECLPKYLRSCPKARYYRPRHMKTLRSIPALGAFFVVIAVALRLAAATSRATRSPRSPATRSALQAFNHWMYVAAKGQAAQSPGQPVIVPNDPPNFTKCIAQVKAEIPSLKKTADKTLKADCGQLFTSLSEPGDGLPDQGLLVSGRRPQAGHQPHQRSGPEGAGRGQEGAVLDQRPVPGVPEAERPDGRRTSSSASASTRSTPSSPRATPRTVTAAAIAAYYASHKSQFGTPETRNMRIVLTKTAAQARMRPRRRCSTARAGRSVAKKYSTDPTTKNKGGLLTDVTAGQQDAALSKAAFAAPVNKVIGPVKGQFGYYVLEVIKIKPATQTSLADVQRADQADADQPAADRRPDRGRQPRQEGLADADHLPRGSTRWPTARATRRPRPRRPSRRGRRHRRGRARPATVQRRPPPPHLSRARPGRRAVSDSA